MQNISLDAISYPNMLTGGEQKREDNDLTKSLVLRASGFNQTAIQNHGFQMIRQYLQDRV